LSTLTDGKKIKIPFGEASLLFILYFSPALKKAHKN
jgi:hypothetical protein